MKKLIKKGKPSSTTPTVIDNHVDDCNTSSLIELDDDDWATSGAPKTNNDNANIDNLERCLENSNSEDTDERMERIEEFN